MSPPAVASDPLLRDLADYDTAFGVDLDTRIDADGAGRLMATKPATLATPTTTVAKETAKRIEYLSLA